MKTIALHGKKAAGLVARIDDRQWCSEECLDSSAEAASGAFEGRE